MEFSPFNKVVKRCLQGMHLEDQDKPEEARILFLQAWNEATDDFEKYLSAYYLARRQNNVSDKLSWLKTSIQFALNVNDNTVKSAFPAIYANIANCYEILGDPIKSKEYCELSSSFQYVLSDPGPFYHGTKADLIVGDLLRAGGYSNYQSALTMNHIYFTALVNGAGLAAELAKGDSEPRVYLVEPTGKFENDPNVTDRKFPGNPTRSYRSQEPLKVLGEVTDWVRLSPKDLQNWKQRLARGNGEIIN